MHFLAAHSTSAGLISEVIMDQLPSAIRARGLSTREDLLLESPMLGVTERAPLRFAPSSASGDVRTPARRLAPLGRNCVVGASDTSVDPLQLVWLVSRDRTDFENF